MIIIKKCIHHGEINELELDLIKVLGKKKMSYCNCIKKLTPDNNKLYFLNNKDYRNGNDKTNEIIYKYKN